MIQITKKVPFSDHQIWGGLVLNILVSIQGFYADKLGVFLQVLWKVSVQQYPYGIRYHVV